MVSRSCSHGKSPPPVLKPHEWIAKVSDALANERVGDHLGSRTKSCAAVSGSGHHDGLIRATLGERAVEGDELASVFDHVARPCAVLVERPGFWPHGWSMVLPRSEIGGTRMTPEHWVSTARVRPILEVDVVGTAMKNWPVGVIDESVRSSNMKAREEVVVGSVHLTAPTVTPRTRDR